MIQLVILSGLPLTELERWEPEDIETLWEHYEEQFRQAKRAARKGAA